MLTRTAEKTWCDCVTWKPQVSRYPVPATYNLIISTNILQHTSTHTHTFRNPILPASPVLVLTHVTVLVEVLGEYMHQHTFFFALKLFHTQYERTLQTQWRTIAVASFFFSLFFILACKMFWFNGQSSFNTPKKVNWSISHPVADGVWRKKVLGSCSKLISGWYHLRHSRQKPWLRDTMAAELCGSEQHGLVCGWSDPGEIDLRYKWIYLSFSNKSLLGFGGSGIYNAWTSFIPVAAKCWSFGQLLKLYVFLSELLSGEHFQIYRNLGYPLVLLLTSKDMSLHLCCYCQSYPSIYHSFASLLTNHVCLDRQTKIISDNGLQVCLAPILDSVWELPLPLCFYIVFGRSQKKFAQVTGAQWYSQIHWNQFGQYHLSCLFHYV